MNNSFEILKKIIEKLEKNYGKFIIKNHSKSKKFSNDDEQVYINQSPYCEPQLGKRMIYHTTGGKISKEVQIK